MRFVRMASFIFAICPLAWTQPGQLKTPGAVLERYQRALGGVDVITGVKSETLRGEIETTSMKGKVSFVF
jgi:hypothetical protein